MGEEGERVSRHDAIIDLCVVDERKASRRTRRRRRRRPSSRNEEEEHQKKSLYERFKIRDDDTKQRASKREDCVSISQTTKNIAQKIAAREKREDDRGGG